MKPIILLTLLLFLAQQCLPTAKVTEAQSPTSLSEARILGVIDYSDERTKSVITAPASVRSGEDFQLTITTSGGGCERAGDLGVVMSEAGATIMVYDFTTATRPGIACTAIFKQFPHTVTLRFNKPGEAVIRVWGRRMGGDTPPLGVPTVLEHRLMVK